MDPFANRKPRHQGANVAGRGWGKRAAGEERSNPSESWQRQSRNRKTGRCCRFRFRGCPAACHRAPCRCSRVGLPQLWILHATYCGKCGMQRWRRRCDAAGPVAAPWVGASSSSLHATPSPPSDQQQPALMSLQGQPFSDHHHVQMQV